MTTNDNSHPELDDPRVLAALDEYLAALEAGQKPDRQAFLAQHSAVAEKLADCLEGMEALHEASSPAQPATADALAGTAGWQTGMPLGDFRILREVGRGGMGVVYEAEQLSLGRRIALKVLPFALTLDPRQLQRFKNEARAAAQLHHQHIVPVYAVGSERGVHFYAMQYIEGQSLAEVIRSLRQQTRPEMVAERDASTGPYLSPSAEAAADSTVKPLAALATAYSTDSSGFYRTVARLGIQAAEALEHAHEYGVVHRDIKPGNLLVDAHGQLWVTDFGLAQFHSDAGLTQSGDLLGTLRYMSPEQAGGQRVPLDPRTDIYSLGATLYELLALRPPFEGNNRQTLLHQILSDEPSPPRSLHKSIPVELETIVLKALAKAPAERYASARELADDLRRFLEHEPIRARRATMTQRLRKWARRHPSVVWAVAVICLLTAAGSLVSAEMIHRAYERERQRAHEAEEEFRLARQAVDGMFKLYEEELADKPFLDGLRRRLLQDYFLVYYQKLLEQRRDDSAAQAELSAARDRVQDILNNLAELQGAGQYHLLNDPAVIDELNPQEEQRQQIRELTDNRRERLKESFRESWRLSAEERQKLFLTDARLTENEAKKILTPPQRIRLRQIDLQRKGARAFEEADVMTALKLTAQQNEQIRAIQNKPFGWVAECHSGPGDPAKPPPQGRPPAEKFSAIEQIKDVLTPQQKQRWRELVGKPFTAPPPPPYGRHPHGPRH